MDARTKRTCKRGALGLAALGGAALSAAGCWVFLGLYLRVDLPGAALLAHLAFRAVVAPLEWLTEGDGVRLDILLGTLALGGIASLVAPRPMRWYWRFMASVMGVAMLMISAIGVLMERALAGGLVLALICAALLGVLRPSPRKPAARRRIWAAATLAATVGGGACYWVYALFMTYGDGYPLLELLGNMHRQGGVELLTLYAIFLGGVISLAGAAALWPPGPRLSRLARLTLAAGLGIAGSLALDRAFSLGSPSWTPALVISAGLLLANLVQRANLKAPAVAGLPGRACLALTTPVVLAVLLMGHTYTARVFRCPPGNSAPYLTRIASLSEVFRVSLFADRSRLALSARSMRRLGWLQVDSEASQVHFAEPGQARSPEGAAESMDLFGVPEDFVHAPQLKRFYASLTAHHHPGEGEVISATPLPGLANEGEINNLLLTVSGDASQVLEVVGIPGMCWLNCVRWSAAERLLYLGCEDRPGLYRYDPIRKQVLDGQVAASLGDVQDIAFDSQRSRLYTVSLWKTPTLTELDQSTLSVLRQLTIGGTHYDVAYDPGSKRVFASAWYGSRVRIVDSLSMKPAGTIPTGLGARALAVAHRQRLLLASSVYDGRLRVCDPASGEVLASLQVGGHVKDIAVDEKRGVAYFWSQCGLYRLDLSAWSRAR